nr:hypothetical protein [Tanacetum cinerariifolium]
METQTSNTLHNAIMEAGGKNRPPMLAPGNYVQWKSKIKRYIDTKPNHELIHYCLKNPPYKFTWADKEVPISEGIDNDIYSTVDACPNACKMWKAIERLKQVVQKSGIQCYNCKEFGHVARECQKPKRVKDAAYHREKMLLLQKVSNNDSYNVFAIESEHPEQSESIHDTYLIEQDEHNVIIDSLNMGYNKEQIDQNDDDDDLQMNVSCLLL